MPKQFECEGNESLSEYVSSSLAAPKTEVDPGLNPYVFNPLRFLGLNTLYF